MAKNGGAGVGLVVIGLLCLAVLVAGFGPFIKLAGFGLLVVFFLCVVLPILGKITEWAHRPAKYREPDEKGRKEKPKAKAANSVPWLTIVDDENDEG